MKHKSVVKALEKCGYEIRNDSEKRFFSTSSKTSWCSWHVQDDKAIGLQCASLGDENDSQSDYSAGVNPTTIKSLINLMAS